MFSANSSLYSRNLSLEVKKGMNKAADLGYYPSKPVIGYKRGDLIPGTKRSREIIIDTEKAGYIMRAFELYSTKMYSYKTLAKKLASEGFLIRKNPVQKANIEKILKNPFYIGEFIYKEKRYTNTHYTPLISRELFYKVQKIIEDNNSPRKFEHEFLYSNLIKCERCGCCLIGEIKKGKYIYYSCRGRKCPQIKQKYLKAETVDSLVENFLKSISLKEENMKMILTQCKNVLNRQFEYDKTASENINKQIQILKKRLNTLYIDKLDGNITQEFYKENQNEFQKEIDELEMNLKQNSFENDLTMEKVSLCIELCRNAYNKYFELDNEKKRLILNLFVSNFSYDGEKLSIHLKSTVKTLLDSAFSEKWWA